MNSVCFQFIPESMYRDLGKGIYFAEKCFYLGLLFGINSNNYCLI